MTAFAAKPRYGRTASKARRPFACSQRRDGGGFAVHARDEPVLLRHERAPRLLDPGLPPGSRHPGPGGWCEHVVRGVREREALVREVARRRPERGGGQAIQDRLLERALDESCFRQRGGDRRRESGGREIERW